MPDIFVGEPEIKKESIKADKKEDKIHHRTHLFAAYCENPEAFIFADKLDDEETLLFLRKHFVTNAPWIIKSISLGIIPLILVFISSTGLVRIDFLTPNFVLMIILFYYFLIFGYIFVNYLTWFYNISIVTTQRIIDIDFSQIVFENVAATKLQIGVIRSVFDYGDVILQTAGTLPNFDFLAVPHPERVIKVIGNLIGESENA